MGDSRRSVLLVLRVVALLQQDDARSRMTSRCPPTVSGRRSPTPGSSPRWPAR